jgi:hypothetical protein
VTTLRKTLAAVDRKLLQMRLIDRCAQQRCGVNRHLGDAESAHASLKRPWATVSDKQLSDQQMDHAQVVQLMLRDGAIQPRQAAVGIPVVVGLMKASDGLPSQVGG